MQTPNANWQQRKIPADFSLEGRRWAQSIHDVVDEIYYKYGRLKFEDLSADLRRRMVDGEGNVAEVAATAKQIMLAVSGGSKITTDATAPADPLTGDLWYDTTTDPATLKRFEAGEWAVTGLTNVIDQLGTMSALILSPDQVVSTVASSEVYKSDMAAKADAADLDNYALASYVNELNQTEIQQRNDAIQLTVTAEKNRATSVENAIKQFTDVAKTFFTFDVNGMSIGKKDSPFKTVLDNERLAFTQDGVAVAYIKYSKMFIREAEITDVLTIGNPSDGYTDLNTVPTGIRAHWRAE